MGSTTYHLDLETFHRQADVQLLDDIDRLRSFGISHYVALPQLVVCGDQSSGKSSVLEAISGIPFPTKDSLCTRFATEVILRRTPEQHVEVTILPGRSRELAEGPLPAFRESLADLDNFADVIESAKQHMGVNETGTAFTDDVLRVDISGPDRPHLTIVDLPGLIHSHSKTQSAEDVHLVQTLVQRYMESSRSIVLATVSAKNDYANQVVLKMAQEVDPRGVRTLGIITKPDTLSVGSESEMAYLNLASNAEVSFNLGWHVLKNRDYHSRYSSSQQRDHDEFVFLSQGVWGQLPRSTVAVGPLRTRLSRVLLDQIRSELPALTREIEQKLYECKVDLRKMGSSRQTLDEKRRFLLHLAQEFQNLCKGAIDGTYGDQFFGDPRSDVGYQKRIRAVVQNLSLEFAQAMRLRGHLYDISSAQMTRNHENQGGDPEKMSRQQYISHAKELLSRSRGRELPGTYNPLLITDLFHEQSSPWKALAQKYLRAVCDATRLFVESTIAYLTHDETAEAIFRDLINPIMDAQASAARETMASVIDVYANSHPITYNHYFTETIQNVRSKRLNDDLATRLANFFKTPEGEMLEEMTFSKLKKSSLISALSARNETDMDLYSCAEAVDCMLAYYKVAMKVVVDNISTQCVEEKLIKSLPSVLSPSAVLEMDAKTINGIARESAISAERREDLRKRAVTLEASLETCRRHTSVSSLAKRTSRDVSEDEQSEEERPVDVPGPMAQSFSDLTTNHRVDGEDGNVSLPLAVDEGRKIKKAKKKDKKTFQTQDILVQE
ncbi:hypothetical protein M409DRAFT_71632 [Zasmidium cellare ATCC 36951]|uniref:GED domain-containing protein n=1 Tax=Zasmidium cellare ATCC 36951 TaxID=1080233 RepID=A0A6A6BWZ5_ZASCE|nr:uncharacterized protein M409DRAFT_71632 [Zasmidium cellare ATCC 36951]KAF2158470.1 hypothetical protein M409DRAFT_71632 [Zasmidium cellare ATCC 36951]